MRFTIFLLFFLFSSILAADVQTGLDVLESENFAEFAGKKVSLIVNHTSVDLKGRHVIDLMLEKKIRITTIFTPEHGLSGKLEGSISNSNYNGIPVVSLYGKNRKPDPEELKKADVIIFDIQDAGARYYTYIATLAYLLESAKTAGKPVIVLDRPNPTGGEVVSGFVPPTELTGKFTSIYPIPTRHGMTIGEIAKLFNDYFGIKADLKVIKMKGWNRSMLWKNTGLKWILPSPNLKTPESAIVYAGAGWIETANISVGRGTDAPFMIYGAPFVKGAELAGFINKFGMKGVSVIPFKFVPDDKFHKYYGKNCEGVKLEITDVRNFSPELFGLNLLTALHKLYPADFSVSPDFELSIGAHEIFKKIKSGANAAAIYAEMKSSSEKFKNIRKKFLIY